MARDWVDPLTRWTAAGVIDEEIAARIRAFEAEHAGDRRLRWPVWLALAFGAVMVGAGVLLFVAAHWDNLSPAARFGLVLLLVAGFHVAGAMFGEAVPAMSVALHTVGTVTLGAAIYMAGQIFNLDEHWPGGVMLWALGAAVAWPVLRHWPQLALLALLAPAWLISEWLEAFGMRTWDCPVLEVPAFGALLLALAYFTAEGRTYTDVRRRVLLWAGGLALPPAAAVFALVTSEVSCAFPYRAAVLSTAGGAIGWTAALGVPLGLAAWMRGRAAWPIAAAALWAFVLVTVSAGAQPAWRYAWWALGATALAAWGVHDARSERINLGAAIFAFTVVAFYFSHVMDKLGRAGSLVGLGALFLVGGVALERARRRMVRTAREG